MTDFLKHHKAQPPQSLSVTTIVFVVVLFIGVAATALVQRITKVPTNPPQRESTEVSIAPAPTALSADHWDAVVAAIKKLKEPERTVFNASLTAIDGAQIIEGVSTTIQRELLSDLVKNHNASLQTRLSLEGKNKALGSALTTLSDARENLAAFSASTAEPKALRQSVTDALTQKEKKLASMHDQLLLLSYLFPTKQERRFLLWLQNSTELRPTGGFWGTYAIVTVPVTGPIRTSVSNVYELDKVTPAKNLPKPPKPLAQYLGVKAWYLRDRNWSPDFAASAVQALEGYTQEGGTEQFDGVLAITTKPLEDLLRLTGPIKINNYTFRSNDAIDTLEQIVEVDYARLGNSNVERKNVIGTLLEKLIARLREQGLQTALQLPQLSASWLNDGDIQMYSTDKATQEALQRYGWAGRLPELDGDGVFLVDANLGSLKTDRVVDRKISYTRKPGATGKYHALVTATYTNRGYFDWRTTRYQTYARLYAPASAKLIKVTEVLDRAGKSIEREVKLVDQVHEGDWRSFGAYLNVEPNHTGSLRWEYELPAAQSTDKPYQLLLVKQAGLKNLQLTLDLGFATTIAGSSIPGHVTRGIYKTTVDLSRRFQPLTITFTNTP